MKLAMTSLAVLIGLLSIAAGGAKVTLVPEEAEFLAQFGFSDLTTRVFGSFQILGGLLSILPATRVFGLLLSATGFAVSAVLIFSSGNVVFGSVSLIPIALALVVSQRARGDHASSGDSKLDA